MKLAAKKLALAWTSLSLLLLLCGVQTSSASSNSTSFALLGNEVRPPQPDPDADFGYAVKLSANGQRLLVGAPSHIDQDDNGAVYLYQWNATATKYQRFWSRFGPAVGEHVDVSPHGSYVALRRHQATVRVYPTDRENNTSPGVPLLMVRDCPGRHVEITNHHLVASCDLAQNQTGQVQVWSLTTKQLLYTLEGDNSGDRFGFDTALDDSSSLLRLTVSAPNANNKTGYVRVYALTSDWIRRIGSDLHGDAVGEQFGFSVASSRANPPYLAVSAPQGAGAVRLYTHPTPFAFDETVPWQKLSEFVGDSQDRLGRDVAMSSSGHVVAASSVRASSWTGQVNVYHRISPTDFVQVAQLPGQRQGERWGNAVALSESGSVIASGAYETGRVRVLEDQTLTEAPPTSSPVAITTNSPSTLSPTRSPTELPSSSPTDAPTIGGELRLEGCTCDEAGQCISGPLTQGQSLGLCISGNNNNVELLGVTDFWLQQGSSRTVIIDDQRPRLEQASAECRGTSCEIVTPVDDIFYRVDRPDSLVASGTIVVAFERNRNLRGAAASRTLETMQGDFEVNVGLAAFDREDDESVAISPKFWIVAILLIVLIILGCCWIRNKKKNVGQEKEVVTKKKKSKRSKKKGKEGK